VMSVEGKDREGGGDGRFVREGMVHSKN